jgi:hypothetical protein
MSEKKISPEWKNKSPLKQIVNFEAQRNSYLRGKQQILLMQTIR